MVSVCVFDLSYVVLVQQVGLFCKILFSILLHKIIVISKLVVVQLGGRVKIL